MSRSFDLPDVERITVGTEGPPGHRVFFLQARQGPELVTLKLEKVQVAALAAWIAKTLEDLPAPGALPEDLDAEPFVEPDWIVGSLGGSYDLDRDRVILVAAELSEDLEPDEGEELDEERDTEEVFVGSRGAIAHLGATREQVAALAIRGTTLVETGRPPCPLCGYPLDPAGHQCPKTNGHRPPQL